MLRNYPLIGMRSKGRLDSTTPANTMGMGTEKLRTCIVIIIQGDKKLSLIHADVNVTTDAFKEEIQWTGKPERVILAVNRTAIKKWLPMAGFDESTPAETLNSVDMEKRWSLFLKKENQAFEVLDCPTEKVFVNIKGEVAFSFPSDAAPIHDPNHKLIESVNLLISVFNSSESAPHLQFDRTAYYSGIPCLYGESATIFKKLTTKLQHKDKTVELIREACREFVAPDVSQAQTGDFDQKEFCVKVVADSVNELFKAEEKRSAEEKSLKKTPDAKEITALKAAQQAKQFYQKDSLEHYQMAVPLYVKALSFWKERQASQSDDESLKRQLLTAYYNLGSTFLKLKDYENAGLHLKAALVLAQKIKMKDPLFDIERYIKRKRECAALRM